MQRPERSFQATQWLVSLLFRTIGRNPKTSVFLLLLLAGCGIAVGILPPGQVKECLIPSIVVEELPALQL